MKPRLLCLLLASLFGDTARAGDVDEGTGYQSTGYQSAGNEGISNEVLIQRIEDADFESLLDVRVELNPDWEVGTPTKTTQRSTRSPSSVTVVSKEQISWFGYNSVAEVLSHISGFSATHDLVQSSFGIRGIHPGVRAGNRNFKVMLDGQPISFRANSQNFIDRNLIPISLIERIEIVKGPVSALYGANAFLGVINIVSKTSEEFIRKGQLAYVEAQTNEDTGGSGWFGEFAGGANLWGWQSSFGLGIGSVNREGLPLPLTSPDHDKYQGAEGGRHLLSGDNLSKPLSFYFKSRYLNDDASQWKIGLHYQELNSDNPFSDLNALRQSGYSKVALYNSFVRLDHKRSLNDNLTASFSVAVKKGAPLSQDKFELGSDQFYYKRNISYRGIDFSSEVNWQFNRFNQLLMGFDVSSDEHELETFSRVEKSDASVTPLSESMEKQLDNQGYYLQWLATWQWGFDSIMGYRHDNSDVFAKEDSFRVGLVYPMFEKHSLKLLYGSSFQAPSPELLYRQPIQRGDVIGNPSLSPQSANTLELVLTGTMGDHFRYTATAFHSKVDDLVVYRDDLNNLSAINAASANTEGIELELSYDSDNTHFYFNAGWQDISVGDSSLFVLENRPKDQLFPKYTVNFGVSHGWSNGIRASVDNTYSDKRPASTSNVIAAETFYQLDDFVDTSVTVQGRYKWFGSKQTIIKLKIHDLWDARYVNPGFGGIDIPTQGRRYIISISQRF